MMKLLFILSCIVLYYILGRLYVEIFIWPNVGNPKDYNDLYRGLKAGLRIVNVNTMDSDWWIEQEKEYGVEWAKVWIILATNIWSFLLIYYIVMDMKNVLVALLEHLL